MTDRYTQHASMYIGDATAERIPRSVRSSLLHVLDQDEVLVETLENKPGFDAVYWDDLHYRALKDNEDTYEFTTVDTAKNRAAEYLVGKNKLVVTDHRGNQFLFIIERSERVSENGQRVRRVEAYGDHYRLRTSGVIEPTTLAASTLIEAARFVLKNTEWQVGITEYSGVRTITFEEYINPLKALHHLRSVFDIELRFRVEFDGNRIIGKYVDFLHPLEIFDGKEIVYGKDMFGMHREEATDEVYTTIVGVGPADEDGKFLTFESINDGKNYIEDKEAIQRWGRHWYVYTPETEDQDMSAERLLSLTRTKLRKHIESIVKYEVRAVALDRIPGLEHENIELGYQVRIKDEEFNPALYLTARVIEEKRSYTDPTRDEFVFGNYVEHELSPNKMIQDLQKLLYRNANRWSASYQKAIDAFAEASEAKEAVDGKIESFFQPDEPTTGTIGDLWFDTDDGNKIYRHDGTRWVEAQDSAIGQALDAASDAKATADGKVTTFFSTTTPTAEALGDLWFNPDNSELRRWDGSAWLLVSDVTGEKTAKDTQNVGGTPATTVRDRANRGDQAKQKIDQDVGSGTIETTTRAQQKANNAREEAKQAVEDGQVPLPPGALKPGAINVDNNPVQSDTAGVYVDDRGILIDSGNFRLRDEITQVESMVRENANMINDHSFEMVKRTDTSFGDAVFQVDRSNMGNYFWWNVQAIDPAYAQIQTTYGTDDVQRAKFGLQAAVLRNVSQAYWYQYVELNHERGTAGPYTISCYFSAFEKTTSTTTCDIVVQAYDFDINWLDDVGRATVNVDPSEPYVWKRAYATIRNLPQDTAYIRIRINSRGGFALADGVQLVPFDRPIVYEAEEGLWRTLRSAPGYIAPLLTVDQLNALVRILLAGGSEIYRDSGGYLRIRGIAGQHNGSIVINTNTQEVLIYQNGAFRHAFLPNGTKNGGSIEIDDKILGMSPVDSPQVLIEYIEFDVPLKPDGVKVYLEERYRKAVANFAVFPSNGTVVEKGDDYFIIAGEGTADIRIVGERVEYENTFWDDMKAYEEEMEYEAQNAETGTEDRKLDRRRKGTG